MSRITKWIDRTFYAGYSDKWDDMLFRHKLVAVLQPDFVALDLGAGRGTRAGLDVRKYCRHVAGTDVDRAVLENPYLHEARLQSAPEYLIPYDALTFDVIYCNSVLEHVGHPETFFAEVFRVLKPGGRFLAKTPNRFHYIPLIASCTPQWFHDAYNQLRGRSSNDTFPTVYRCNSASDLTAIAQRHGLKVQSIDLIEGRPEYLP